MTSTRNQFVIHFLGLALATVGFLSPWVPHKTAALTVTGFELAEFAKFFPQVQGGVVSIHRELFYCPLIVIFVLLGLLASRSTRRAVRLIVPLGAAAALLVVLLPFAIFDAARQALTTPAPFVLPLDYKGQLVLVIVGVALTLLAPLTYRLPGRIWSTLVAVLALAGIPPALWQFVVLRPLIAALYSTPLNLGWGLVVCVTGFGLLLVSSIPARAKS